MGVTNTFYQPELAQMRRNAVVALHRRPAIALPPLKKADVAVHAIITEHEAVCILLLKVVVAHKLQEQRFQ